jgi:hypothetical protein
MKMDNTARDFKDYEESGNNFKISNDFKSYKSFKVQKHFKENDDNITTVVTMNGNVEDNNISSKNFKYFIGIDVAKYKLDLYDTMTDSHRTIKNNKEDLSNYISNIIKNMNDNVVAMDEVLIIIDLTGGYEKLCLNTFYGNGFKNIILAEGLK